MALIRCPECGKEVSDLAPHCIHCGFPLPPKAEIEAPDSSNDVQHARTNEEITKNQNLSGVGGWLGLLVFGMIALGPLMSIARTGGEIQSLEQGIPALESIPKWQTFKIITWLVVGSSSIYSIISGILLVNKKDYFSVKNALVYLWIGGPVAACTLNIVVPHILFGSQALESIAPQSIGAIIGSILISSIWTAYLLKSKRVKNTYS